jgi:hypothetical protein
MPGDDNLFQVNLVKTVSVSLGKVIQFKPV